MLRSSSQKVSVCPDEKLFRVSLKNNVVMKTADRLVLVRDGDSQILKTLGDDMLLDAVVHELNQRLRVLHLSV